MRTLRLKSCTGRKELHEWLDKLDAVAIRCDMVHSIDELELARHLAESSFEKKKSIARQLRYEFLLWLSGKTDIKSAMEAASPREADGEFFVIVFSGGNEREILGLLDAEKRPLALEKKAEPLALERISLSRITR
jgi:tRNA threonylcarbamoyladenosine modification (KEOPS) complex Cgi121 subunit